MGDRLIRVIAPHFVAGFVSNGRVSRTACAPVLRKTLAGRTDDDARAIIAAKGWRASVVPTPTTKGDAT